MKRKLTLFLALFTASMAWAADVVNPIGGRAAAMGGS